MQDFLHLISSLKQTYGDPLYGMSLGNTFYIFRPLQPAEYGAMVQTGLTEAEHICQACVVWPEQINWERVPAADPDKLVKHILDLSGFGAKAIPFFMLEEFREEMNGWKAQAEALIILAFPNKTLEELSAMPIETFLRYLSRAEFILKNLKGMDLDIKLEDPREEKPPVDKRAQIVALRENGIDPMTLYIPERRDSNWVGQPFIHGVDRWRTWSSGKKDEGGEA